jgi:hypothetical protein
MSELENTQVCTRKTAREQAQSSVGTMTMVSVQGTIAMHGPHSPAQREHFIMASATETNKRPLVQKSIQAQRWLPGSWTSEGGYSTD